MSPVHSPHRLAMLVPTAGLQGLYYLITGVWALVSVASFQFVTGPKTDIWLVHTVAVLVIVIGVVLLSAAVRRHIGIEAVLLGLGSALGLAAIEVLYVIPAIIGRIYLMDAVLELLFVGLWLAGLLRRPRQTP